MDEADAGRERRSTAPDLRDSALRDECVNLTRDEAELDIRKVDRHCMGKAIVPGYIYANDCGFDVNDLIVASFPFDGSDHMVPCPQCGETATFSTKYDTE
jgi:hypothetical protein